MQPFRRIESRAVPLDHDDVDTDVITPMNRVMEGIDSMIEHAFEPLRFRRDGSLDRTCPLNDPAYRGAEILIAGRNFGCGSSRETAVWAITGLGVRCVIAASFGDIFFANCFKNGVLPIVVDEADARRLMEMAAEASTVFTVDLETEEITPPSGPDIKFEIGAIRREGLLYGLDEIGVTLRRQASIDDFVAKDRRLRPWIYQKVAPALFGLD